MALLWQAAAVSAWQAAVRPCARPRTVRAGPRASASSEASSFGAALARAWQQDPAALRELLGRDVVVDTPIWSCTDALEVFVVFWPYTLQKNLLSKIAVYF